MTPGKRILLVVDDVTLRQSLAEQIELLEEASTLEADDAAGALALVRAHSFDAILLGMGLPDMDGHELCRVRRREGVRCPIIMLTAAGSDADAALGLDAGASDTIVKPFRLGVLLSRLRAHILRSENSGDTVAAIGPYTFRPTMKLLTDERTDRRIRLTEKETAILDYLHRAGGKMVGRDTLLGEVWGYNAGVTTHTLETHVYRLRRKIERDPSRAEILLTEPGGYRLGAGAGAPDDPAVE